jgi:3-hydroxyisobutyrate dehydrogenase-like beta-hydroxyacid dehydrogenase
MGENIIRMGDNGKGLIMKICHNALVSQIQNGVNETSALAARNGIDILTYAEAISYGGGQNFYLDSKKNAIAKTSTNTRDLESTFWRKKIGMERSGNSKIEKSNAIWRCKSNGGTMGVKKCLNLN